MLQHLPESTAHVVSDLLQKSLDLETVSDPLLAAHAEAAAVAVVETDAAGAWAQNRCADETARDAVALPHVQILGADLQAGC